MTTAVADEATAEPVAAWKTHAASPRNAGLQHSSPRDNDKVQTMSATQRSWADRTVAARLSVLRRARRILATRTDLFAAAISSDLQRNTADTLVAEVLPLLAACEFLECEAAQILAPRRLGRRGLPLWLAGIESAVERVPLGRILVIAPSNYPLFLPGVQVLQALAAGNAVIWKPGIGGGAIARLFVGLMDEAGLPGGLLEVTDESVAAAEAAIAAGVDKVFFTGSAESGRRVMRQLAETLTPSVMELSGCDAVVVLPSAKINRTVKALGFGMRLNGSATCMAPRRVILIGRLNPLAADLSEAFRQIPGVTLSSAVREQLETLVADAVARGATLHGAIEASQRPLLLTGVTPEMPVANADLFAPLTMVIEARNADEAVRLNEVCAFALTVSVFGAEREALAVAARMTAGTVLINDLIVPTADPRVPFGGRRQSGFGVTRGAEGLLEMTAARTVLVRRGSSSRAFEPTTDGHFGLFNGVIRVGHAGVWGERLKGIRQMIAAGRRLR